MSSEKWTLLLSHYEPEATEQRHDQCSREALFKCLPWSGTCEIIINNPLIYKWIYCSIFCSLKGVFLVNAWTYINFISHVQHAGYWSHSFALLACEISPSTLKINFIFSHSYIISLCGSSLVFISVVLNNFFVVLELLININLRNQTGIEGLLNYGNGMGKCWGIYIYIRRSHA